MKFKLEIIGFSIFFIIGMLTIILLFTRLVENKQIGYRYEHHICKGTKFAIDSALVPYWNSFTIDADSNNFNYNHIYCINNVVFGYSHSWQGITFMNNGEIQINKTLINDSIGMKFVFYHELGHWFGLNHDDGIMTENYNSEHDSFYVKENWDALVKDYFEKLKQ